MARVLRNKTSVQNSTFQTEEKRFLNLSLEGLETNKPIKIFKNILWRCWLDETVSGNGVVVDNMNIIINLALWQLQIFVANEFTVSCSR
jgi:hypothetical protein